MCSDLIFLLPFRCTPVLPCGHVLSAKQSTGSAIAATKKTGGGTIRVSHVHPTYFLMNIVFDPPLVLTG